VFDRGLKRYFEKRDEEFKSWTQEREEKLESWAQEREEKFRSWSQEREEKLRKLQEETREFNREILLRNEKVYTSVIAEMEEGRRQIQANTQAVLSALDRLNGSSA
jgi:flagellar biosynthesis/type III secretory pathway protein FliH